MKVAIINPFGNSSGHSLNYSSKLCQSVAQQNVELTLFTSSDFDPTLIFENKSIKFEIIGTQVKNSTINNKDYKSNISLIKYGANLMFGNLKVLRKFKKINRKKKFDVVHIIGGETVISILFFFFTRRIKSQLILTIHNCDFIPKLYYNISKFKHHYKQFIKYILERHYFKRFSKIMVHGEQMKYDLEEQIKFQNKSKIYPINIGLDVNNKVLNIPRKNNTPRILFFGIIRQDKGLHILLSALKNMNSNNVIINIFGKPAELKEEEIITLVNNTGKKECVNLDLRYFNDDELDTVFNDTDYVILPYLKTFKAQSVVLTLAAAYKKTLICSDTGQNGFDVNKYEIGYTFEAENVDDLTRLLNKITTEKSPISSNTKKFDNYILENSWDKMGEKIYYMYKQ